MINPVYSIRDKKGDFWSPRIDQNEASAIRGFAMLVNSGEGMLAFAPQDFDLYEIAQFNSSNGQIVPNDVIKFVVNGQDVYGVNYEK